MAGAEPTWQAGWVSTESGRHLAGRVSKNTKPELALRRALHAQGARFRLHPRIAKGCTPDLVLPRHRVAVFVDGDFFHGCPEHGRTTFKGPNAQLWQDKLAKNRQRDDRSTTLAQEAGWTVVRVWECQVSRDAAWCARLVLSHSAVAATRQGKSRTVTVERPMEVAARMTVAAAHRCPVLLNDDGLTDSAYDFRLDEHPEPAALEVVSYASPKRVAELAAWGRHTADGTTVPELRLAWLVSTDAEAGAQFGTMVRDIVPVLAEMEQAAVLSIQVPDMQWSRDMEVRAMARALGAVGVGSARGWTPQDPALRGRVNVTIASSGLSALGPDAVVPEVEQFLSGQQAVDVRSRLKASGLRRRHAFVWVDGTAPMQAWWYLRGQETDLPSVAPRLPQDVTDVWWVTSSAGWWFSTDRGWSAVRPLRP